MMEDFYAELEQSTLRPLFPADMMAASRKSAAFFIGLLGGPPLYHQRYGNPMMRARHMAFTIMPRARGVARLLRARPCASDRALPLPRRAPRGIPHVSPRVLAVDGEHGR